MKLDLISLTRKINILNFVMVEKWNNSKNSKISQKNEKYKKKK